MVTGFWRDFSLEKRAFESYTVLEFGDCSRKDPVTIRAKGFLDLELGVKNRFGGFLRFWVLKYSQIEDLINWIEGDLT